MIVGAANPVGLTQGQSERQELAAPGGNALQSSPAAADGVVASVAATRAGLAVAEVAQTQAADRQRLQQHIEAFIAQHDQEAHFSYDKSTGLTIVQIVNRSSGELVRQIPNEEVVRLARYLDAQNAFLDVTA